MENAKNVTTKNRLLALRRLCVSNARKNSYKNYNNKN